MHMRAIKWFCVKWLHFWTNAWYHVAESIHTRVNVYSTNINQLPNGDVVFRNKTWFARIHSLCMDEKQTRILNTNEFLTLLIYTKIYRRLFSPSISIEVMVYMGLLIAKHVHGLTATYRPTKILVFERILIDVPWSDWSSLDLSKEESRVTCHCRILFLRVR